MGKDVLEVPDKLSEQFMYNEMLKQVVAQKKAEFEAIQGKIVQYKTQLSVLEETLRRKQVDFDAEINQKKSKLQSEESIKRQDWTRREEALSRGEAEFARRSAVLEGKETQAEKLREERDKLMLEKLRYERLNREAEEKMNKAAILDMEIADKVIVINNKEKKNEEEIIRIKNEISILETKKAELTEIENNILNQTKNLDELRKELTPKAEEYNNLIAKNDKLLAELKEKELSIAEKLDADNRLFDALQVKDNDLKKLANSLKTWEEDLKRREMAYNK